MPFLFVARHSYPSGDRASSAQRYQPGDVVCVVDTYDPRKASTAEREQFWVLRVDDLSAEDRRELQEPVHDPLVVDNSRVIRRRAKRLNVAAVSALTARRRRPVTLSVATIRAAVRPTVEVLEPPEGTRG